MTIAYRGDSWRSLPQATHLADRFDLLSLVQNADVPGRPYVLHTTDEPGLEEKELPEYDWMPFDDAVANHVICYRNADGKLSTYSLWKENTSEILSEGEEVECYDYSTQNGRLELSNITDPGNALYSTLKSSLGQVIPSELREPLPESLQGAQAASMIQYLLDIGQGFQVFLPQVSSAGE